MGLHGDSAREKTTLEAGVGAGASCRGGQAEMGEREGRLTSSSEVEEVAGEDGSVPVLLQS